MIQLIQVLNKFGHLQCTHRELFVEGKGREISSLRENYCLVISGRFAALARGKWQQCCGELGEEKGKEDWRKIEWMGS